MEQMRIRSARRGKRKNGRHPAMLAVFLVRPTGFEPAAYRVGVCHSIQLSYGRIWSRGRLSPLRLIYYTIFFGNVKKKTAQGYLKSDVGFFCFRVFEKGGCSKVLCGVFSFRAVRGKAVAVKFYVGFPIRSDLCRKRHRHLTEDADAFLLECSGNQLNNSSSFCWSVPSLAYGSASNCRKLCLMSFVSSLKPRMYESAM